MCKIDCEFMILVFLITLIFSIISIYLWFHFPLLSFNKHNLLLVLAALSLIIFLSNSLSYSYLNYEFNGNHLSSINSHLPKCITFSYQKKNPAIVAKSLRAKRILHKFRNSLHYYFPYISSVYQSIFIY